jgi:uncharacterized protein (DUF1499 family)
MQQDFQNTLATLDLTDRSKYAKHILDHKHEYGKKKENVEILKVINKVNLVDSYERYYIQKYSTERIFKFVFWDVLQLLTDVSEIRTASIITAMMKAVRTSGTSVDNYFTRQYIPEDKSELQSRRRENLKSH